MDHRVPNGMGIVLHAVENHNIKGRMKHLIIGNANHKEQCQEPRRDASHGQAYRLCRPAFPKTAANRSKYQGKGRQKRRRFQADSHADPQGIADFTPSGRVQLPGIDSDKRQPKHHDYTF